MKTTFIPEGMFARYYIHPTSTKVIVTDGRSAVQTELKTGKPTQAEVHLAIETCCGKLTKLHPDGEFRQLKKDRYNDD